MKAIKANSERLWDANWKKFRVKFEPQYLTIIDYMQVEFIDQYKEKIVRYWTDYILYFRTRTTSRGEVGHGILKNELGNSRGDFKEIMDKFHFLLKRIYENIRQQEAQESRKVI